MVEIKSYQPEFIEKQVEIGQSVYSNWRFAGQSTKEQLEQSYSAENFDPDTRLYAFKDGEMVGFLPSSVQPIQEDQPLTARLEFPLVLDGHEDVIDDLFTRALDVLKSKNVERITVRAGPAWGYTENYANSNGFEKANEIIKQGRLELSNWNGEEPTLDVTELDMEDHEELVRKMFFRFYPNAPDQAIENAVNQLKTGTGVIFLTQKIIIENNEIVGRLTGYINNEGETNALLGTMASFEGENQHLIEKSLINAVLSELKDQEIEFVDITLSGPLINAEDKYKHLGVEFKEALSFYNLQL